MTRTPHLATRMLAGLLTLGMAPVATAQSNPGMICGTRANIVGQLNTRFGEQARAIGLAGQTRIVEVFVSDETGSWTITVTSPDGTTCLIAAGEYYETLPPAVRGQRM